MPAETRAVATKRAGWRGPKKAVGVGAEEPVFGLRPASDERASSRSPQSKSSRRESNPRFLFVREVSLPLDHGTKAEHSTQLTQIRLEMFALVPGVLAEMALLIFLAAAAPAGLVASQCGGVPEWRLYLYSLR